MANVSDNYRKLFDLSPDAILIMEGDRFVDCNPTAARMMRFPSRRALLDRYSGGVEEGSLRAHPAEFSPPTQSDGRDSYEKAEEYLQIVFERGSLVFEWDHLNADGEVFTVEVMLTLVEREPTPIIHVVWREITERKEHEQEIRRAQRLEAVGRLAGGIAHDFNNLLTVILSYAEMLENQLGEDGLTEQAEEAREIRSAGERAAALSRQLLAFSKGQPIKPRPIDLVQLLEALGSMLRRLIGEQIEFVLDLPARAIIVEADPSQIEQLVVNLCVNARDAMQSGGRLAVSLDHHRHERGDHLPRVSPGEYAAIRVSDTGEGMDADELEHAFDPFFSTKGPGAGTGLGLATVRAIAEQGGGGVHIESKPGAGTAVNVLLPSSSAHPAGGAGRTSASSSLDGGETVLLAEDEEAVRNLVQRVLKKRGYRVICARDGAEALELATRDDAEIDLVITDAVMPRLSGVQLADQLQTIRPGLKIIFMSGYAREGAFTGMSLGDEAEILEKPFSPSVLLKAVRKMLDAG